MARVRERFVAAVLLDGVFVCFIALAGLVHALSRGHADGVHRSAVRPFAGHALHVPMGLLGFLGLRLPVAATPSRALRNIAPLACVGDVLACGAQVWLASDEASALNEYALFAVLAALLAASSLNVYWAARAERATFESYDYDVASYVGGGRQHDA